jgi:hypothetical protein
MSRWPAQPICGGGICPNGLSGLVRHSADSPCARHVQFLELLNQNKDKLAHLTPPVRQGVHRRAGRGSRAASTSIEFACGIPQLLRAFTDGQHHGIDNWTALAGHWAWSPASRRSTFR